jgi:hypothetical protein
VAGHGVQAAGRSTRPYAQTAILAGCALVVVGGGGWAGWGPWPCIVARLKEATCPSSRVNGCSHTAIPPRGPQATGGLRGPRAHGCACHKYEYFAWAAGWLPVPLCLVPRRDSDSPYKARGEGGGERGLGLGVCLVWGWLPVSFCSAGRLPRRVGRLWGPVPLPLLH